MRRRGRARWVTAVLVAAVLAGCSSGDGAASGATTTTTPATTTTTAPTTTAATTATTAAAPPFIDHVRWVQTDVGPSLQVYPTPAGRVAKGPTDLATAWAEVLALDPTADTPGMFAQLECHWTFARLVEPDKPSWNLEPDRPVVSAAAMVASRCNPGGAEETSS